MLITDAKGRENYPHGMSSSTAEVAKPGQRRRVEVPNEGNSMCLREIS